MRGNFQWRASPPFSTTPAYTFLPTTAVVRTRPLRPVKQTTALSSARYDREIGNIISRVRLCRHLHCFLFEFNVISASGCQMKPDAGCLSARSTPIRIGHLPIIHLMRSGVMRHRR